MGPLPANEVGRIDRHIREGERRKKERIVTKTKCSIVSSKLCSMIRSWVVWKYQPEFLKFLFPHLFTKVNNYTRTMFLEWKLFPPDQRSTSVSYETVNSADHNNCEEIIQTALTSASPCKRKVIQPVGKLRNIHHINLMIYFKYLYTKIEEILIIQNTIRN